MLSNHKNDQTNQTDLPETQNKNIPSYQNTRPVKNHSHQKVTYASPPMSIHPPPVRSPPIIVDITTNYHRMQQRVQQQSFEWNWAHIRPNNLKFPYAVRPRSNNRKYQGLGIQSFSSAPQLKEQTSQYHIKIQPYEIPQTKQPTAYEITQPTTTNQNTLIPTVKRM